MNRPYSLFYMFVFFHWLLWSLHIYRVYILYFFHYLLLNLPDTFTYLVIIVISVNVYTSRVIMPLVLPECPVYNDDTPPPPPIINIIYCCLLTVVITDPAPVCLSVIYFFQMTCSFCMSTCMMLVVLNSPSFYGVNVFH